MVADGVDTYTCYCLDQAVGVFGRWIEGELNSLEGKTSRETEQLRSHKLKMLLAEEEEVKQAFADPALLFSMG